MLALSGRGWRRKAVRRALHQRSCQVVSLLRDSLPYPTLPYPIDTQQVVALLRDVLAAAGLELYLAPYGVLPTNYECCIGYLTLPYQRARRWCRCCATRSRRPAWSCTWRPTACCPPTTSAASSRWGPAARRRRRAPRCGMRWCPSGQAGQMQQARGGHTDVCGGRRSARAVIGSVASPCSGAATTQTAVHAAGILAAS